MIISRYFLILILVFSINPFFAGKKPSTLITGEIINAPLKWIYVKAFSNNNYITLDSAQISKKGKYKLKINTGISNFYSLYLSDDEYLLLVLDSTNKKVIINADAVNINQNYSVEGSDDSELIKGFIDTFYDFKIKADSLNMMLYSNKTDYNKKEEIKKELKELENKFKQQRNNFINDHSNSLAVLTVLSYLKPSEDLEWYKKIEKGIGEKFPNSEYHIAVQTEIKQIETQLAIQEQQKQEQIDREKRSAVGSIAPELGFKSPEGEGITLESLRGNYVLIDFWASWCRPCRMENPNVVRLYNEYHDKGFTVYSVSLDNSKDRWVGAIAQDGLIWPNHVSDLKQWNSEAVKIYNFRGIPFTVLIDPDGRIIAKNLRGPSLENKLKEIFGE